MYLEISNNGFGAYHSAGQDVVRGVGQLRKAYGWETHQDCFKIIDKYKHHPLINKEKYIESLNFQIKRAFIHYINEKIHNTEKSKEIFQGIKQVLQKDFFSKYYRLNLLKTTLDIFIDCMLRLRIIYILTKIERYLRVRWPSK